MTLAIDTNRYTDFWNDEVDVVRTLEHAEVVYIPFVVLAELRAGFLLGTKRQANEQTLRRFLNKPGVHVLLPDEETSSHYAMLFRQLSRQGTPIPTNDIWIAALTVQRNLALYTRDTHFDHLPQVNCI